MERQTSTTGKDARTNGSTVPTGAIAWDTEERIDIAAREGRIRGWDLYMTAALLAWMESTWDCVLTYVKTSTNVENGEILLARAQEGEPGAVPIRRIGTQNVALLSWWRPLKKLGLKVPPNRQYNVKPVMREVDGVGTVFVFPMAERQSAPRNRKSEADLIPAAQAAAAVQP